MKRNIRNSRVFNALIKKINKDPEQGLKEFYQKYAPLIVSVATASLGKDGVDHVVNDVLIKIWQFSKSPTIVHYPIAWLSTITRNCVHDRKESEKSTEIALDVAVAYEYNYENEDFYSIISQLNEISQEIFIMKFVYGYSFKEIATELNKPISTVTTAYYKAIEEVKAKIEEEE